MSRPFASPLGDLRISALTSNAWIGALAFAVAAHLGGAALYPLIGATSAKVTNKEELEIAVALGPPGGRIDLDARPPPPPPPKPAPATKTPKAPSAPAERAPESAPMQVSEPPPPVSNAPLSSAFGEGGAGTVEAPPPPLPLPPPPPPRVDPAIMRAYTSQAAAKIHDLIDYPAAARRERAEGTATVRIVIVRNGEVTEAVVLAPTGNELLNLALDEALTKLRKLDPLPASYRGKWLRIELTIRFELIMPE